MKDGPRERADSVRDLAGGPVHDVLARARMRRWRKSGKTKNSASAQL